MDAALKNTKRWNEWQGYAPMLFDSIYHVGPWLRQPSVSCQSERTYLKLHGSINWFSSTGRQPFVPSPKLVPQHPRRGVVSLWSSPHFWDRRTYFGVQQAEQLLVPPGMHKDYHFFRPLWDRAEKVLATAEQLVIIGFSFAPADVQAQWLLHRGLAQNKNPVSVILVDPNGRTSERIGALIHSIGSRHQIVRQYDDFGKYIRKEFGSVAIPKKNEPAGV